MTYYEVSFLLCLRERLSKKLKKMGFGLERLESAKTSDDPSFFKAREILNDLKHVEQKLCVMFGESDMRSFPGDTNHLSWVRADSMRLMRIAKGRFLTHRQRKRLGIELRKKGAE